MRGRLEGGIDEHLRLGARHEHARADTQLQAAERRPTRQVLQRNTPCALVDERLEAGHVPVAELVAEHLATAHLAQLGPENMGEQQRRITIRGFDAGVREPRRSTTQRRAQRRHAPDSPTAARRAASSASSADWTTASRSPSSTASRLYDL